MTDGRIAAVRVALGAEGRKGRLVPGAVADLAVLSQDVFEVPVERLPETEGLLTLVEGDIVHREGEMVERVR